LPADFTFPGITFLLTCFNFKIIPTFNCVVNGMAEYQTDCAQKLKSMKLVLYLLITGLSIVMTFSQNNPSELSHYVFPEFTEGVILMKTGVENKALLNYNSLTEEMIFENRGQKLALGKTELDQVDTVFIRDRKFLILNKKFVELVYRSKSELYAEHRCTINSPGKSAGYGGTSQTSAISSYSMLPLGGRVYELKLPEGYITKPYLIYSLKKEGKLNKFVSIKQLMKLYDDKKNLVKAYVRAHDVKYDDQESIIQFLKYLESN